VGGLGPRLHDDDGGLLHPRNVLRDFQIALDKANLPKVRLHDLRHTVATLLLHEGAHPKVVQELLGHANVAITLNTYSHATQDSIGKPPTCSRACSSSDRHHLPQGVDRHPEEPVPDPDARESFGPTGGLESASQLVGRRSPDTEELRRPGMVNSVTSVGGGRRSAGSSVSTNRRWSWVLIVILPNVVQSVANLLSSSSGPIDGPDISERCWRRPSIVRSTPNVTLGYLASITNVTLGLQRADGNVTIAGQSSVGVTEEAPQAI